MTLSSVDVIACLPKEVRARLRSQYTDPRLRDLVQELATATGSCAPHHLTECAIDEWVAAGAPEPVTVASCLECGRDLVRCNQGLQCRDCDLTYGPSWERPGSPLHHTRFAPPFEHSFKPVACCA